MFMFTVLVFFALIGVTDTSVLEKWLAHDTHTREKMFLIVQDSDEFLLCTTKYDPLSIAPTFINCSAVSLLKKCLAVEIAKETFDSLVIEKISSEMVFAYSKGKMTQYSTSSTTSITSIVQQVTLESAATSTETLESTELSKIDSASINSNCSKWNRLSIYVVLGAVLTYVMLLIGHILYCVSTRKRVQHQKTSNPECFPMQQLS